LSKFTEKSRYATGATGSPTREKAAEERKGEIANPSDVMADCDSDDPKRSVLAWQEQKMPSVGDDWLRQVRDAFQESQERG